MSRTFVPHDYQEDVIDFICQTPRCAVWAPMGGGKTVSTLTALERLSVVEDVYPALVLAPLRVAKSTWPDEVKNWAHLAHLKVSVISGTDKQRKRALERDADIFAMNYENLSWLRQQIGDAWPFKTVIADECFVAGTAVSTPHGPRNIEDIEPGDVVYTHAGPRPVTFAHKRFTDALNLVCLKLSNGDQLHVTAEHPIFTDIGWLPARACGGRRLYGRDCLSDLSNALSAKSDKSARTGAERPDAVLRQGLPHAGHFQEPTGTARKRAGYDECAERGAHDILELWEAMVRCPLGEYVSGEKRPHFSAFSRGKRHRNVSDGSADSAPDARWFSLELHRTVGGLWAGLSLALQAGFRRSAPENMSGGGWRFAPYPIGEGTRRAEEREVTVLGVDGVSDRQRGGLVPVFNLEVEGAPTYFAAGFLVHNCTRLKSFRLRQGGSRARALGQVAHTHVSRFIGLTGTPAPNGVKDLWGQQWFIDQGERLGRTFSAFEQRWFRKGYDGYSLVPYEHTQREVQDALRDVCLTVKGLDVDEPLVNPVYVELPPLVRECYKGLEDTMYAEIGENIVEAANAAVRTQKLLQLTNGALYVDGTIWEDVHAAKLDALDSIIEEANGAPVLVAYNFKHDLQRLQKRYKQGRVLDADPATIKQWNAGEIPLLFAHPACLTPQTEVLTENRGWVKIVEVKQHERVHDGVDFVAHKGCAFSGVKPVISVFGIGMTLDHKLLIGGKWLEALDVRNSGRTAGEACYRYAGDDPRLREMLAVRAGSSLAAAERPTVKPSKPQVLPALSPGRISLPDWHSDLADMEGCCQPHDRSKEQGLRSVWRGGPWGMRRLAQFREFLSGHARRIFRRSDDRPDRQFEGLQSDQLPMGHEHGAAVEQSQQPRHPVRGAHGASGRTVPPCWREQGRDNPAPECGHERGRGGGGLPEIAIQEEPETSCSPVYDLVDCGPRNRFLIRNDKGEVFISHNSAGHGLNLADGGNILAFFGVNWNLEEHMQIIERIGPMRQKQAGHDRPCLIYPILARDTVDELVMERLSSKRSVQDILLEALKRRGEKK